MDFNSKLRVSLNEENVTYNVNEIIETEYIMKEEIL
jgi:hypothetical protein